MFFRTTFKYTKETLMACAEYLSHAQCMRNVQSKYAECASEYQNQVNANDEPADLGSNEDNVTQSKKLCWLVRFNN